MSIREPNYVRTGAIGLVVAGCLVLAGLQYDQLQFLSGGIPYRAEFADAGGLIPGDEVTMSGMTVGSVSHVDLAHDRVLVDFTVRDGLSIGDGTRVAIKTQTVLGRKSVDLQSDGHGPLRPNSVIPLERSSSPYSLTDALDDLGGSLTDMDTESVNRALDAMSDTMQQSAPDLRGALDGVTRLSRTLNTRDEALEQLLSRAENVTAILADRSDKIESLVVEANNLTGELSGRRDAIAQLIANVEAVSTQLSGFVADNEAQIGPALTELNAVTANLVDNRENIDGAIAGLAPYALALGESVSNGPFFNAYVANLLPASWWRIVADSFTQPDQVGGAVQDAIPRNPPTIKRDGDGG